MSLKGYSCCSGRKIFFFVPKLFSMPHIHTQSGQIDLVAEVFCVFQNTVLFRLHEKYGIWLPPGGHVELNETPEEAAVREVKEETGLDVTLWNGGTEISVDGPKIFSGSRELLLPSFMNVHSVSPEHRHISMVYFGMVTTDNVVQPNTHEKTTTRWLTAEQVRTDKLIAPLLKKYALAALDELA